eukprot:31156-Rhodomonas_salina.2
MMLRTPGDTFTIHDVVGVMWWSGKIETSHQNRVGCAHVADKERVVQSIKSGFKAASGATSAKTQRLSSPNRPSSHCNKGWLGNRGACERVCEVRRHASTAGGEGCHAE